MRKIMSNEKIIESILNSVNIEFNEEKPSMWRIFIYFDPKECIFLYNDRLVPFDVIDMMIKQNKIESESGIYPHQSTNCIRYKFSNFKYHERYYRNPSKELRKKILKKYDNLCVSCNLAGSLSIDHIIPWFYGGLTEESNLQILCTSCNSKKNAI